MSEPLTVVVPARNEAGTIERVIRQLLPQPWVGEVVVVDNASDDGTAQVAAQAGARTVYEPNRGMGHAVRAGLRAAQHDWVMKVDADLDRFDVSRFGAMAEARAPGVGLVKGNWQDPADNMPMTRLLVMPALAQIAPGLRKLRAPNSGIYIANRTCFAHQEIVGDYAADLDVMLRVHASGAEVVEVDIGEISHDTRDLSHYNAMAETIMAFFMDRMRKCVMLETVVIGHDAVEIIHGALGYVATRARAGSRVRIYLERHDDPEAQVLQDALAALPTVQFEPLDRAHMFSPESGEGRVRVMAPYPTAGRTVAVREAMALHDGLVRGEHDPLELLLMPATSALDSVHHLRADFAFDVADGALIKAQAQAQLARLQGDAPMAEPGTRETYQSFESLPQALRDDLSPEPGRVEAGGPA